MIPIEIDIKSLPSERTHRLEAFSGWMGNGEPCDSLASFFVPITEDGDTVIKQGGNGVARSWNKL